jgi:hypothetical protein
MSWVETEIASGGVRDKRLRRRRALLLERLSDKPTASIPAACRSWAETQAPSLWEALGQSPVQGHLTLEVPRQPGRQAKRR